VGKGVGPGLAISHGIVRDHGSSIEVKSAAGIGGLFRVVLPQIELRKIRDMLDKE
jgi:two-component system, NtrC family, sensor kinase